jgi:signal transduction histidine kinase
MINDPNDQAWFQRSELAGLRCVALAPITAKGKTLGALTATRRTNAEPFDDRQVALLSAIAAQAGIAIENARLFDGQREANRLQAEFVANMSHELRTPLNVIIGYGDLLAEVPFPPRSDAHAFVRRIAAAGRALHRLVESVLEYARLDRGRTALYNTRFPATRLLNELGDLCHDLSGGTDVMLSIQDTSDIVFASDYDRLYSILSNLLLNALKFTDRGSVQLSLHRLGDEAEFTVRDTGIGIAADALPHVFEPFRQVDGSPTRMHGGVGLGLAIVRRNVELLHGRVEVESQVSVGTTFRVRVPIALEPVHADRSAPPSENSRSRGPMMPQRPATALGPTD